MTPDTAGSVLLAGLALRAGGTGFNAASRGDCSVARASVTPLGLNDNVGNYQAIANGLDAAVSADTQMRVDLSSSYFDYHGQVQYPLVDLNAGILVRDTAKSWQPIANDARLIEVAPLASEQDTLLVSATDGLGQQSKVSRVDLVRPPAPWLSPFAMALYLLVIISTTYGCFWYRNRQTKTYQKRLKDAITRRTSQLLEQHEQVAILLQKQKALTKYKDDFIAMAAHELKSPVTTLALALAELSNGIADGAEQNTTRIMRNQLDILAKYVEHLADSSSIGQGDNFAEASINLSAVARRAIDEASVLVTSRRLAVQSHIEENAYIMAPSIEIELLVSNLLKNAFSHSPTDAAVKVVINTRDPDVLLTVENRCENTQETLEKLDIVFKYGEKLNTNGKHLGLQIIKRIIESHGAAIQYSVASNLTRVTVAYPQASTREAPDPQPLTQPCDPTEGGSPVASDGKPRILVVDDSMDFQRIMAKRFNHIYHIELANNGQHALDVASTLRPDAIVLDAKMPYLDGYDFLKARRNNTSLLAIPVISLTSETRSHQQAKLIKYGADVVIEKRGNLLLLDIHLQRLVEQSRATLQPREKQPSVSQKFRDSTHNRIESVIELYYQNAEFDVTKLCSEVGISYRTMVRRIGECSKYTPQELIFFKRCEKARTVLKNGRSIEFAADECGFSSTSKLRHWFKRFYNCSPQKYLRSEG